MDCPISIDQTQLIFNGKKKSTRTFNCKNNSDKDKLLSINFSDERLSFGSPNVCFSLISQLCNYVFIFRFFLKTRKNTENVSAVNNSCEILTLRALPHRRRPKCGNCREVQPICQLNWWIHEDHIHSSFRWKTTEMEKNTGTAIRNRRREGIFDKKKHFFLSHLVFFSF